MDQEGVVSGGCLGAESLCALAYARFVCYFTADLVLVSISLGCWTVVESTE